MYGPDWCDYDNAGRLIVILLTRGTDRMFKSGQTGGPRVLSDQVGYESAIGSLRLLASEATCQRLNQSQ